MNTAIFEKMTEQLTRVFNDPAQLAEYQAPGFSAVSYGWDGRELSPVTRAAYVQTYGADTVERAEQDARARLAATANSYEASAHAAAEVFGKSRAAYLLDAISCRVQSWCNPALNDED